MFTSFLDLVINLEEDNFLMYIKEIGKSAPIIALLLNPSVQHIIIVKYLIKSIYYIQIINWHVVIHRWILLNCVLLHACITYT